MSYIINVENVSKSYGDTNALNGINLKVKKGEIMGLLGPNGAGKTTLIKSIIGILNYDGGLIEIDGREIPTDRKSTRDLIGFMPQDFSLYEDLSIYNNIKFFGQAHHIEDIEGRIKNVLEFTNLTDAKNKKIRSLSGGMKRRASLACALIHQPKILFLDEPTAGVDPELRENFWNYFRELAEDGVTVLITTHMMDEAYDCDRLALIHKGKIVKVDSVENIMNLARGTLSIKKEETEEYQVDSNKEIISILQDNGLSSEIESINIKFERLQEVILKLIKEDWD